MMSVTKISLTSDSLNVSEFRGQSIQYQLTLERQEAVVDLATLLPCNLATLQQSLLMGAV
jgi:hypothetical protein